MINAEPILRSNLKFSVNRRVPSYRLSTLGERRYPLNSHSNGLTS
jgi:hypothetical protein